MTGFVALGLLFRQVMKVAIRLHYALYFFLLLVITLRRLCCCHELVFLGRMIPV